MTGTPEVSCAVVEQRVTRVTLLLHQERTVSVGFARAEKLGCNPKEIDALPTSVMESFCPVRNPLGLRDQPPRQTVLDLSSRLEGTAFLSSGGWFQSASSSGSIGAPYKPTVLAEVASSRQATGSTGSCHSC
jgi:hypothetical protein